MKESAALMNLAERLNSARVLVVGDLMLDRFVYGQVDRISPEAPIPILKVDRHTAMLGGAGNVVRNLTGLGAHTHFIAAIGSDGAGREAKALLGALDGVTPDLIETDARPTAIKTRYLAGNQQLMRADEEVTDDLSPADARAVIDAADAALNSCDVLVLSDYGKGVLSDETTTALIDAAKAKSIPVIVDPKGRDYGRYRGATLLTPNRKELIEATAMAADSDDAVVAACRHLMDTAGVGGVLATRSQEGMSLITRDTDPVHLPTVAREVFDVSGAGDTVVATLAAAIAAGGHPPNAAALANLAAGIVVGKVGTAAVYADELVAQLHHRDFAGAEAKVLSRDQAIERVELWRTQGHKVGFTNGCFDILHPGHVSLLSQARAACDRLVLGLNSDASVKRLKGCERPINSEGARATVLTALASVDAVVIFGEDTPLDLIGALRPDVLVKGSDYAIDEVVGADVVHGYGGKVHLADLVDGHSTTSTIGRINNSKD